MKCFLLKIFLTQSRKDFFHSLLYILSLQRRFTFISTQNFISFNYLSIDAFSINSIMGVLMMYK